MEDEQNSLREMLEEEEESKKNVEKQVSTLQTQVDLSVNKTLIFCFTLQQLGKLYMSSDLYDLRGVATLSKLCVYSIYSHTSRVALWIAYLQFVSCIIWTTIDRWREPSQPPADQSLWLRMKHIDIDGRKIFQQVFKFLRG